MVDNLRGGDPGRPPQALSPSRPQPGPQEGGYLSLDSSNNGNPAPRSPSRSADDEYDFQMNNFSLLKAQLKLVTHERDMLKKDVKKITMERDGALKHLSLTTGNMELGGHHHHRTASDTASGTSTSAKPGQSSTLSRSHSIASAGDKSLILSTVSSTSNASSPPTMHHQSSRHELSNERLLHELQITKKQLGDALKKNEQTHKDAEFYHAEAESIRTRYNDMLIEKQRSEQEVASLRLFMDEERKEMAEMRRQQQEVLNVDGGEPLSLMYSQLLQNYENVKDEYSLLRKRYDDLAASHSAAVSKLEHSQEEISRYKKMYNDVLIERNQFKQQCTQAIRQWDQALREKTEYKDALTKVKRQHDDAIKEINQAMTVRIKASKDLKRLTEERNAAMQEYSLIMSERDSVHKDIEKMQEELKEKNKKLSNQENRSKHYEDDKRKLSCKIEMLKRELEQSLHERDKAMKETHEIRERVGGKTSADHEHSKNVNKHRFGDIDRNKKDRDFASTETIDTSALASKKERLDNLDQANAEIEKLRKLGEKLTGELQEATMEADVAKGRRDWAFSERDKVVLERESIRTLCDKLRRERDRAVSELAEALRDSDDIKKDRNETQKENKDLRERLEIVEKSLRMKSLQRSTGHSHSHDSAIDSDLQEWETETLDLDMAGLGSQEDLLLDLAGGRDDLHCPVADKPIYVSSIAKGSFLEGKLKVNDCILRVNNVDCRDIDRSTLIHTLKTSTSTVNLLVKRRRVGKRYSTTLNLNGSYHGISLELGAYVAKIQPGSVAAKEGSIAVGDRIVGINDQALDHLENINDALKLLESNSVLSLTLAKSYNAINHILGGPLSSSSSGQNMQVVDNLDNEGGSGHGNSKKSLSATTSPIKDTIRGSQEMIRKLISKSDRSSHGLSSSSSEKVYSVNTSQNSNQHSKSSKESSRNKLIDTVKEKFDNVTRGKRRGSSKEPSMEAHLHVHSDHDIVEDHVASSNEKGGPAEQRADMAIAELDSVINSYNSASSGTKSSGNGGSKKKRSKDRDSFRSGGTWPRTRGGPIIEHGTGTILHPQKQKKERLPLAELLSNLPKYPPEAAKVPYRANEAWSRSTRDHTRRSRPVTTYDMLEQYGSNAMPNTSSPYRMLSEMGGGPRSSTGSREPSTDHQLQSKAYLSPSDTSIDESVKSAQAGKDVLEQYLKKSKANTLKSASSGLNTNVVPPVPSTSSIGDLMESVVGSPPPAMPPTGSSYFKSEYNSHLIRPQATPNSMSSGFSPYYSSPKYSTPPLPSSESMLGSPIPDFTNQSKFYHHQYDSQATGSQPHSLTSVSPTSGLYHQRGHSPSPSQGIEYLMAKTRGHSSHYGPIPPYSGYPGYAYPTSSHQPSSYLTQQQLQQHQNQQHPGYHHRPAMPPEETSPPPVYEYLSTSRPGKDNYKFRIPSNTSVASHGSASTAERPFSKCSSPLPIYSVQYLLPDGRPAEHQKYPRKPHPGEIRQIYIEKSSEALGITIKENQAKKGVFVSSVSENSLANQVGLQVGDQILDVCGVNLRACGKEQAALVLQKSGNSMTLRVQYNPGEYHSMLTLASSVEDNVSDEDEHEDDSEDESESESEEEEQEQDQVHPIGTSHRHSIRANPNAVVQGQAQGHSRSGSPTPRNSPRGSGRQGEVSDRHRDRPLNVSLPPSAHSTLTRHQISQVLPHLHSHAPGQVQAQVQAQPGPPVHQRSVSYDQPRWVFPVLKKSGDLGVRLVGGNAVGIFIHSVDPDSAAFHEGLRQADQILEYNGIDLRQATAEQAAYELAKPAEKVTILVQYNPGKYDEIKDKPGDSYYVRAMFDRLPDPQGGPHQLAFRKDDILFIDNTMYNGVPGHWSAWLVDLDGQTGEWGIVPSKYKVDEELLKRTLDSDSDLGIGSSSNSVGATTRKTWTATRRSFFKRRKGGRSSSRESSAAKELASFSDMASLNYSDSGALHEVEPQINSYVRVERLDYMVTRPVLIIGPLNDVVTDKLISDFPHKFSKCEPKLMNLTQEALEKGIMNNVIVDFKRRGSQFECYTLAGIKEICERNQHCIVNVHMDVLERLHQNQVYPIVLLVKFKSVKQIKEIKDPRHLVEKISQKDAKNMFESTQSLEADYKPYISDTIHAGANLMLMCAQINSTIDQEQNKTLWVPSGTIW